MTNINSIIIDQIKTNPSLSNLFSFHSTQDFEEWFDTDGRNIFDLQNLSRYNQLRTRAAMNIIKLASQFYREAKADLLNFDNYTIEESNRIEVENQVYKLFELQKKCSSDFYRLRNLSLWMDAEPPTYANSFLLLHPKTKLNTSIRFQIIKSLLDSFHIKPIDLENIQIQLATPAACPRKRILNQTLKNISELQENTTNKDMMSILLFAEIGVISVMCNNLEGKIK